MHRIIGRVLLKDTLFYLSNRTGIIIGLFGRIWFRPLCYKLYRVVQGVREWCDGIRQRQRQASGEAEGLGSIYDKRKWMEAYYGKPNKATSGCSGMGMHNT
ncbi:hypothetical protein [Nitrosospira sp. NpAV]|uniref:hypothetical protein n=1 Tax=Nitrosospira sp. NpAV TaxID=58133 RepID=UPI0005A28C31|nr:hypothetical protein [Nitrosospira sp. NpAV]KIO47934.1 hypothetical protein SQ11_14590 [Nitrosospira sp. NpAV]